MSKIDDLYHILSADLFPEVERSRSRLRAIKILEAAIECYTTYGIENTTYEKIAQVCGVTRPLILKYFKDYEDLFYKAIKFIRVNFQLMAVNSMKAEKGATEMLLTYVDSTFKWIKDYPRHAKVWLLYLYHCSYIERDRDLNTQFVEVGRQRIAALLRLGCDKGQFVVNDCDATAKQIQTIITGALLTLVSENLLVPSEIYQKEIQNLCLSIAGCSITEK